MNQKIKIIGLVFGIMLVYYGLQYASTAVHYNCQIIKDDCPPPISHSAELIYRVMVQPSWLDQFAINPMTYFFKDGQFSFWQGQVDGQAVVIRVERGDSPVMSWIRSGLPLKTSILPADGEQIKQWLATHPEYEL